MPISDQPPPTPNPSAASVQAMVRADLEERERVGIERYGTPLQPNNGRDALIDAYQESLDQTCYLRQMIAEREERAEGRVRALARFLAFNYPTNCCGQKEWDDLHQDCRVAWLEEASAVYDIAHGTP